MARGQTNKMDKKGITYNMKVYDECRIEMDYFRQETKTEHALRSHGQMTEMIPVNLCIHSFKSE
jgi:hypothetical protein